MFDWLTQFVTASASTYLIVLAIVAVDGFFPLVPGETAVITAAILAADHKLSIWLVVLAAALGALAGDNFSYLLGDQTGERAARRLFRGEKSRDRLEWARRQLHARGSLLVVVARFIPGGRTATTFASGTLELPWRRFIAADALAAALWAIYAAGLGYLGGEAFRHSVWKPLAIALGISACMLVVGELVRRRRLGDSGSAAGA